MMFFLGFDANAQSWDVNYLKSNIGFSGKYLEEEFNGQFLTWEADIDFDPYNLSASQIIVKIDLASVETNNQSYTRTLAENDWFNSQKNQFAFFSSREIRKKNQEIYSVIGDLEINGIKRRMEFDATIKFLADKSEVYAEFFVDRLSWDIGKASDNSGSWVDRKVKISINLIATKS